MDVASATIDWKYLYRNCQKSENAGGYSRQTLNAIADSVGIRSRDYSKKDQLCQALKDYIQNQGLAPEISLSTTTQIISTAQQPINQNEDMARLFDQMAVNARPTNRFRADALATAAHKIRLFPRKITAADILDSKKFQKELDVGSTIVDRIKVILETGTHPEVSSVSAAASVSSPVASPVVSPAVNFILPTPLPLYPVAVNQAQNQGERELTVLEKQAMEEIMTLYGFGEKIAEKYVRTGVTGINDLINKVNAGYISLNDAQTIGLTYYLHFRERIPYDEVKNMGEYVLSVLQQLDSRTRGAVVGSHRRGKATSGDVDVLISGPDLSILGRLFHELINRGFIVHKLVEGPNIVRGTFWSTFPVENPNMIPQFVANPQIMPGILRKIDIKVVPERSWGTGLLHYTGSDDFNQGIRSYLKKNNLSLSEYSIRSLDGQKEYYFNTEEDLFHSIGLPYVPPNQREEFRLTSV